MYIYINIFVYIYREREIWTTAKTLADAQF